MNININNNHVNSDIERQQMQWDLFVDKFSSLVCVSFFILCIISVVFVVITL